ncbi:MAG: cbb3-type cytochrome c oxidase subunit I, partial [Cyanobacteria bacterium NC_groundwater_1444_Ag_S-0.65um_54_12]|nr:cbb3-type cytochrome c oxidase subunit I [Cyanobacteria bacterium NC_groundwater_1444_Ag_S-0.65um_54_12]
TAVSLQGMYTALVKVNRVTHFTQWTIAHSHMGLYAFVTFVIFGAMYYIFPRITGYQWPSRVLIAWHFWLVVIGIALYVTALSFGGVFQGLALERGALPFSATVEVTIPYLWLRTAAGVLLVAGHLVFAYLCLAMVRRREADTTFPAWQRFVPIMVDTSAH